MGVDRVSQRRGKTVNERFFDLPEEKRRRMMNAGYRVFAQNSYRKSPMSEIADAAGISKSLLFHYFGNKRGLYLFLWEQCVQLTQQMLEAYGCYEPLDFFSQMRRGLRAKMALTRQYPEMAMFALKSFYEKDPAIQPVIRESYERHLASRGYGTVKSLRREDFGPGVNLPMMCREMFLASEGYVWEALLRGDVDADRMEREFEAMIDFWEETYGAKEGGKTNECD